MAVDVVLGLQWGDEGKGKIVDVLTPQYDMIARFQGGPNAGHTLEFEGHKHVLHTIPSGIFRKGIINIIGNGVVIDPVTLQKEIEELAPHQIDFKSSLYISKKAHLIIPTHLMLDAASEAAKGNKKIGSTLKGIGPTYMDKTGRNGLRVGDIFSKNFTERYNALKDKHIEMLSHFKGFSYDIAEREKNFFEAIELIRSLTCIDSEIFINEAIQSGKKILAEGAQGSLLDIDFGTYPFVTSSNTVTAGTCTGLGVAPQMIKSVVGIFKAYCTRVGSGAFPTELFDEDGENLRKIGHEFGATTGRPRRCGWIDLVSLKYAIMLDGATELTMMKADVLSGFEKIKVCTAYQIDGEIVHHVPFDMEDHEIIPIYTEVEGWNEDLTKLTDFKQAPQALKNYVQFLEKELHVPITVVSVGPDRKQTLKVN